MNEMKEMEELMQGEANPVDGELDLDGLFDNPDSLAMGDMSCIDFEKDGKPIALPKPPTPFEELHSEKYDKYLVPIFIDKYDKMSFNGNGVIVDNYLITAAHVAICNKCKRNISKLYYLYEGEYKEINNKMVIHNGRGAKGKVKADRGGIHDDLIIYNIQESFDSFLLSSEPIEEGVELAMFSFRKKWEDEGVIKREERVCSVTKKNTESNGIKLKNCFEALAIQSSFFPGNSGSILFKGGIIYGMLIIVNQKGYGSLGKFLSADYIKEMIDKHKESQLKENAKEGMD